MEQFDAIERSEDPFVVQPDAYSAVPQWGSGEVVYSRGAAGGRIITNSKRLYIYGGIACAFIVFLVLISSSNHNNSRTEHAGNGIYNGDPMLFHGRHPAAGNYHDSIELYIREDIHELSSSYTEDTELTTNIESDKQVKDLPNGQKQWDITTTHLSTDTELLGQSSKCDTDDRSRGDPLACAALFASADTRMSFVIDADGKIVSETDTDAHGHIMKHARVAGGSNPVESVDNALKYLPDRQVTVGEDWDSQLELASVGSYSGRTTFVGYTKCGTAECAVLKSSGKVYMDVNAMSERFASLAIDPSMLSITDGTISQTIHWDDTNGYFPYIQSFMNFTIQFSIPARKTANIPVKERVTVKASLIED